MGELLCFLFDETHHVVKTSTTDYVPVCYEIVNLFIEPLNFLLIFFICKLKGFCLIVTTCGGFCCSSCIFPMPFLVSHFTKAIALGFLEQTVFQLLYPD